MAPTETDPHTPHVYHWEPNAHQGKPVIALYEKGVDFVSHYVDLLEFEQVEPAYLAVNPQGIVPAMLHRGRLITESAMMCEYIDAAFPGPPLRPASPYGRWRMRCWSRFMDDYLSPSLSMAGWKGFMGPMARRKDPARLQAFLDRIPVPEMRVCWSTAIHDSFTEAQLAESRRRVQAGVRLLEQALGETPYLAGADYSLADINAFATIYALPLSHPELCNATATPNLLRWLRAVHARPSIARTFSHSRMRFGERVREMRVLLGLD